MKKILLIILLVLAAGTCVAQEGSFGQNKVQYKKFNWYYIQTPTFDIYFYKGEDTLAVFAADVLQGAYLDISEELNYHLSGRVPIIIYASHNEFQQTNVISDLIPEGVGGFTEVFKNRIVIPFTGSYEDFRHVLHHELTHAVWFDLIYGNVLRSILSTDALFRPPLWFSEGYAEYSSRNGWDLEADMFMRDAVIQGYLPPLDYLDGFLAYKGGESALKYITEKYGQEKISEILNKGKALLTMDRAVKSAVGVSMEDLSEGWQKSLKRVYWPEIAQRQDPEDFSRKMTDHTKDGSLFNQKPEWSPKGDRLAFFSDRHNPQNGYSDRFNEVFIMSTVDGKIISRLVKAERSGDMEELHSYYSGLAWSPDGSQLTFASKSHGNDVLYIYDAKSGDRKRKIDLKMEGMRNPSWSPDGEKIAFEGMKNGFTDLYIYDLKTNTSERLMQDKFDDNDPSWSNDGAYLAFSSDRDSQPADSNTIPYGNYDIFLYDTRDHSIKKIVDSPYKDNQPAFSPDGERIAFISNRNGIDNIYLYEIADSAIFPVTDIISGAFSPTWSPTGDQLAYSAFYNYGYDIYIVKNINNVGDENNKLKPTHYMQVLQSGEKNIFVPEITVAQDTTEAETDTTRSASSDFSTYIFQAGEKEIAERTGEIVPDTTGAEQPTGTTPEYSDSLLAAADTLEYKLPDGSFKKNDYKLKFSPELVTGGFSYDNFYGLQGQSYLAISDVFGDHHFYIYTDLINSVDQSNLQLAYSYTALRTDFTAAVFHFNNLYYNDYTDYFFDDRVYGAQGNISYPFSKFTRLDFTLSQVTIARDIYDDVTPNKTTNLLIGAMQYVNDAIIWGATGPVSGHRYNFMVDQSLKTVGSGLEFRSFELDYRKYWSFWARYNFALRLSGGISGGKSPKNYYLGGTANWIDPSRIKGEIYSVEDIYVNELVVPVRGYKYFSDTGTRFALVNAEFRYPFIDYFKLHFPLPIAFSQIGGAIFWDMGASWNKSDDNKFFDTLRLRNPRDTVFTENGPDGGTVLAGFGFGPRANLGLFVLRVDIAWSTNLNHVSHKPDWYFSFGSEF